MKNTILFPLSALLFVSCSNSRKEKEPEQPNILFILTDDQGWSQVSSPMHPKIPESASQYLSTPNIDRLGDAGMRFTSGYAPAPISTPTRRCILTGTSAARSGTEFTSYFVPAEHMTIPNALKQANPNYFCAHFGKWGEGMISSPEDCGYDASDGETDNRTGGSPSSLGVVRRQQSPPYFIDNEDPKRTFSVTDSAVAFMQRAVGENRPFYVQVSYYAVHLSIICREETLRKYQQKGDPDRRYSQAWTAMLDELDKGVGSLLDALDVLGISDNTYVFFMSDNGSQKKPIIPGKNEKALPVNYPLSGSKQTLFEGGIRVPFLVRGPGIKPRSCSHVPVVGYDLLPTFYDLAGGTKALPGEVDGGSIRPLFKDPDGEVERQCNALIFHRPGRLSSAIRQGPYKLFIKWNKDAEIESRNLYNLDAEVIESERTDIIGSMTDQADQLQNTLLNYLRSVNARDPKSITDEELTLPKYKDTFIYYLKK